MNDYRQNNNNRAEALTSTNCPLSLVSATFESTTQQLGGLICNMIASTMNIPEIDFVSVFPIKDKGQIVDFGCDLYFNTTKRNNDGKYNIWRLGSGNNTKNVKGKINLMSYVNGKNSTGGFGVSDKFTAELASCLNLDNDGNIIVNAAPNDNRIAIVEADLWALCSLLLNITSDDNYDFILTPGKPLNNKADCIDYQVFLSKEVMKNEKKKGRSGVNYEQMAARRAARNR